MPIDPLAKAKVPYQYTQDYLLRKAGKELLNP